MMLRAAVAVLLLAPGASPAAENAPAAPQSASSSLKAGQTLQGDLGHPYYLPQASRARMHQCAIEWQRMKLAGEADTTTWRIFATSCLVSQDDKTNGAPTIKK